MQEAIAINNPVMDMMTQLSYSQRVAQVFWKNTNTLENQARSTTKLIDKKIDFLTYNLERMIDLPKIPNLNRIEATATALYLDKMKQTFSTLEKSDLRDVLELLEVLRNKKIQ